MNANDTVQCEELEHRVNSGLAVSLLWWRAENRVSVVVADSRSGATFELAVRDEQPLDVFHHPFAYAAFRGVAHEIAVGAY